jgi:hypothetical protein
MLVALGIQHSMRMCHIVICGLSGSTVFNSIHSYAARFSGGGGEEKKKKVIEHKIRVLIFSANFVSYTADLEELSEI